MAENTKIQWATHTFNPWIGCTKVSPGCDNCYAEALDGRLIFGGVTHWGAGVARARTASLTWRALEIWNQRQMENESLAKQLGRPLPERPRVFCASLADVADEEVPLQWKADLWALLNRVPYLNVLLLTKRPHLLVRQIPSPLPPNIWLGTTVEDQERTPRVTHLTRMPASVHFLSVEPMLGAIVLPGHFDSELPGSNPWVICGGESGPGAREFKLEWAIDLMNACKARGVPFFMKQLGSNATFRGREFATTDKKGGDPEEWPHPLRVREFPAMNDTGAK